MKQVLEPLAAIPGVRMALLVSHDGVPVVVRGKDGEDGGVDLSAQSGESLAALASGWLNGITRSLAPQSWDAPERVVLRAARGTLVMLAAPGAVLLVHLARGASAEDLRLPMESAVARMQRVLRESRPNSSTGSTEEEVGSALPSRMQVKGQRLATSDRSRLPGSGSQPG